MAHLGHHFMSWAMREPNLGGGRRDDVLGLGKGGIWVWVWFSGVRVFIGLSNNLVGYLVRFLVFVHVCASISLGFGGSCSAM